MTTHNTQQPPHSEEAERGVIGLVVNEADCIAAKEALDRGETVLLREGNTMTGTCLRLVGENYEESAL